MTVTMPTDEPGDIGTPIPGVGARLGLTAVDGALPMLIGCSHGTADDAGRATIRALLQQVRDAVAALGGGAVEVREAFVDVQYPRVDAVVATAVDAVPAGAVVVPLLLSGGFHVHVDIARAVGKPAAAPSRLGRWDRTRGSSTSCGRDWPRPESTTGRRW